MSNLQKKLLEDTVKAKLKDPESAKFKWPPLAGNNETESHVVSYCFQVNAKNGFGSYSGFQNVYAMFVIQDENTYNIIIAGIGDDATNRLCAANQDALGAQEAHDPRITDDQARAGCSILEGKLFCASPGTGRCWEKGHNPWKGEAPARAIDVGTSPSSPDYNHSERCG